MTSKTAVKITGAGSFLPGNPVPLDEINTVLGELPDAPKEVRKWMTSIRPVMQELLGIEYYHYAIDPKTREFTEDNISMSAKASLEALKAANMQASEIELIVYGATYMYQMPPPSTLIQEALGIEQCAELSIAANCTSAYKALLLAGEMIETGRYQNALVVSSNMSSSHLCAEYYNQPITKKEDVFLRWYLCDGAAALVLKGSPCPRDGLFLEHTYMESVGGKKPPAMFTQWPGHYLNPREAYEKGYHHVKQLQDELRKYFTEEGSSGFTKGVKRMIEKYRIDLSDLRYFQINMPTKHLVDLLMDEIESLGIRRDQIYSPVVKMGYTGPPAAFMSVDEVIRGKTLKDGDLVLNFVIESSKFMQAGFTMRYYNRKGVMT